MSKTLKPSFRDGVAAFDPNSLADAPDWRVLSEPNAAKCLDLSVPQVRNMRKRGEIPYVQLAPRRIGITVGALRRVIEDRTVRPAR